MGYGVGCWVDGKMVFSLGMDSAEPDVARDIAIALLEARLQRKIVGEHHGMKGRVTRIVVTLVPEPKRSKPRL